MSPSSLLPTAAQGDGAGAPPRRRVAVAVLSAATGLWLFAQLVAGITMDNTTWPITGFGMFRGTATEQLTTQLIAETRSGRTLLLDHSDLGLPRKNQLGSYVRRRLEPGPTSFGPNAHAALARLAEIYNARHSDDPAVALTVVVDIHPLSAGVPVRRGPVLSWSAR